MNSQLAFSPSLVQALERWALAWRRAFAGITWQRILLVLALCLAWALQGTSHEIGYYWEEQKVLEWLVWSVGTEFANIGVIALTMAIPLVVVGNLGPQTGWRRIGVFATTIALAALVAAVERYVFLALNDDEPRVVLPATYLTLWVRYAQFAALLTAVMEFQRRAKHSVESMHHAEIDRLALDREMDEARLQVIAPGGCVRRRRRR